MLDFHRIFESSESVKMIYPQNFSSYKKKTWGYGAFVGSLLIVLSMLVLIMLCLRQPTIVRLQFPLNFGLPMPEVKHNRVSEITAEDKSTNVVAEENSKKYQKSICNLQERRSDFCEMNGDIRVSGNSSSVIIASWQPGFRAAKSSWNIRPYARKDSKGAMQSVKKWSVNLAQANQKKVSNCSVNHSVPGILFSIGGFSGNHFHDFSDLIMPLYLTSHQFSREVQFLVTDYRPWWILKFRLVIEKLSRFKVIDIDTETRTHCFPSVLIGLKCNKDLRTDPSISPEGFSTTDFTKFLRNTYSLERNKAINLAHSKKIKPRLMIISRKRSRLITNENRIRKLALHLGYDVVVAEASLATNLSEFAQLVNSCDILLGVHGAGLTNMVFLPQNATVIQIIPFGMIEKLAREDFEFPARNMKLRYLQYHTSMKESSLIKKYPLDDMIFTNPMAVHKHGWDAVKKLYLDEQNLKLNVHRFRAILVEALQLLRK